jgi:hypothetical protein
VTNLSASVHEVIHTCIHMDPSSNSISISDFCLQSLVSILSVNSACMADFLNGPKMR